MFQPGRVTPGTSDVNNNPVNPLHSSFNVSEDPEAEAEDGLLDSTVTSGQQAPSEVIFPAIIFKAKRRVSHESN